MLTQLRQSGKLAGVADVVDPLGGSYYVEALTHSLATEAWKLIEEVEALWAPIAESDDWAPFHAKLAAIAENPAVPDGLVGDLAQSYARTHRFAEGAALFERLRKRPPRPGDYLGDADVRIAFAIPVGL